MRRSCLQEHWPAAVLLWALAAWAGWALLRDQAQQTLALLLLPAWIFCELGYRFQGHIGEDVYMGRLLFLWAILYLTSGATGEPKMAMVTHQALIANVDMAPSALALTPDDITVAFLPSAHIAQRVVVELVPIRCGMPVAFAESLMKMPQDIKEVRPTIFLAPPRLWERIYTTICTEVNKRPGVARKIFYTAIALGLGTMIGWKRIVITVGEKIGKEHLTYAQGASAEIIAMATIGLADKFGLPVSTTHVLSSGIAGTMAANRSGLQGDTLRNIALAWILTLPVCVLLGASIFSFALYVLLHLLGVH